MSRYIDLENWEDFTNTIYNQCEFCGKKFGSIEEARKCESGHIMGLIKEEYKYGR